MEGVPSLSILLESYWNPSGGALLFHPCSPFNSPRVLLELTAVSAYFSEFLLTFNSPRVLLERYYFYIDEDGLYILSILLESYWNGIRCSSSCSCLCTFNSPRVLLEQGAREKGRRTGAGTFNSPRVLLEHKEGRIGNR